MARKKGKGVGTKPKKVKVTPIERDGEGGPEPYAILDRLIASARDDLVLVRIALAWRSGWAPDKDGQLKAGKCCKPNEVSRQFMDSDLVILLNEDLWPHFTGQEKEELVYHELMHAVLELEETTGEAKLDTRNRPVLRLRHHDIEEFHAVRERYGEENLAAAARRIWQKLQEPRLPPTSEAQTQAKALRAAAGNEGVAA
jgi:hypothetical protein